MNERGREASSDRSQVGAGEARERNETSETKKENQEHALGWKEKSIFIAPHNELGEEMKEAF